MNQFFNNSRLFLSASVVVVLLLESCGSLNGSTSSGTIICSDYHTENVSTLDVDLVHTMVDNYRAKQLVSIQNTSVINPVPKDAHSIWFDLETLKKFLYHIENTAKNQDPALTDAKLGVRIYYAAYPQELEKASRRFQDLSKIANDPLMQDYDGLHTLVIIPTIDIGGQAFDFNPNDKDTYKTGVIGNKDYKFNESNPIPNSTAIPALSGTSSNSRNTGSRNHGSLIPPGVKTVEGF